MARLPIPPINPNNPIPNNPFYAPTESFVQGEFSPFIIGSGLTLDLITGVLSATGGVAGLVAGPGIDIITGGNPPGSTATITNVGVRSITASSPLNTVGAAQTPNLTIDLASTSGIGVVQLSDSVSSTSSTEAATSKAVNTAYVAALASVQSVGQTAPITITGTPTAPVVGVSVATAIATGVVSVGTNINVSPTGQISVDAASTTAPGVVQLNNTTLSDSTTQALTAKQGKLLQQQIDALLITNNITLAGTYDAATGLVDSVTPEGSTAGFNVGSALPAAAPANEGYFVIIDVEGSTGPSGTPPYHVGDWFLSSGTTWQFLNVGFQPPYATTSTPGVVELSDNAETQAGSDATLAVTPASLQSKLSDSISTTSSTTIASSTAVQTAYNLAAAAIPCSIITAKGNIIVGSAAGAPVALAPGSTGQVLYANTGVANGVCWGALPTTPVATPQTRGIVFGCTTDFSGGDNTSLGVNTLGDNITTGQFNVAIGGSSSYWMTTGCYNTALGNTALFGLEVAGESSNTAIGYIAMANAGGSNNTAVGALSGYQVGSGNLGGDNNVFLGYEAGCNLLSGCRNVVIGSNVQALSATDSCQLAIGFASGQYWLTGTANRNIRPGAGIVDCTGSSGTGGQVLASNGANAVCWQSIANATSSVAGIIKGCTNNTCFNTFLGCLSGSATAGAENTIIGYCAAPVLTSSGLCNIAIGTKALQAGTSASDNVVIGCCALGKATTAQKSIAIGREALGLNVTANQNIAIGIYSLGALTSGNVNVSIGEDSGSLLTSGDRNSFFGYQAGRNLTSGSNNVAIGNLASLPVANGSCQLAIGYDSSNNWLTGNSTKAIKPGAGIIDSTGSCGSSGQVLASTGANSIVWATSTAPSKLTATKSLTNGTPIDLLSWSSGVRMGSLAVFMTDNASNVKWANVTIGSASGVGSSGTITQSVGLGNFTIVAGGSGQTIVRFTPSVTLASVDFVYQYNAAFGPQPSVL